MADRRGWWAAAGVAVPAMLAGYSGLTARAAERAVPRDGEVTELEGGRLHYVDRGAGDPIVMIHGLGGQLRNFSYSLADCLPDHRLILVDRPGSGYSTADGRTVGVMEQAALIAKLIVRLGLGRPLIVGHSLGGAVALAMALDHPDQVGALALIAPATQPQTEAPPVLAALAGIARMPTAARRPFAWVLGTPLATLAAKRTRDAIFAPEPVPDDVGVGAGLLLSARPGNIDAAAVDLADLSVTLPALAPRYPSLNLPVGILYARGDRVLDPELHGVRTADAIAGATIEMMDGGHMIPLTQPERVAAFIRGVAGRQA